MFVNHSCIRVVGMNMNLDWRPVKFVRVWFQNHSNASAYWHRRTREWEIVAYRVLTFMWTWEGWVESQLCPWLCFSHFHVCCICRVMFVERTSPLFVLLNNYTSWNVDGFSYNSAKLHATWTSSCISNFIKK